ncbi:putative translation regulator protein [Erysiphe necator]|uniref:Putative translation regulator protein n=1 Tax=Uncinula necator TaxID=52586 RepID=A0A0B1P257_UNCNE|nr:putative translation regulator protein [Erysiphe necator]
MLDKTTTSLESGAARHIWPACKKQLQSYSGLQPRSQEVIHSECSWLTQEILKCNRVPAMVFFDFLYPIGFSSFIRQSASLEFFKPDVLFPRHGLGIKSCRYYNSSRKLQTLWSLSPGLKDIGSQSEIDIANLLEKLGLSRDTSTIRIWQAFKNASKNIQRNFRKILLKYLHHLTKDYNAEIIIELFRELDFHEKDADICEYVINAFLRKQNLLEAVKVHNFAVARLKASAGLYQILRYTVKNEIWEEAYKLWKTEKSIYLDFNFYRFVDESAPEVSTALSLSEWVNNMRKFPRKLPFADLIKFSITIIEKALQEAKYSNKNDYFALLKSISDWKPLTREIYTNVITSLIKSKNEDLVLQSYRALRRNKNFQISQAALTHVLRLSCNRHDVLYMKCVLDDYFLLYSKPSRAAYRICLREFSRQGDAKTVHALFNQYVTRYKSNTTKTLARARHQVSLRSKLDKSGKSYLFEEIDEAAPLTANDFAPLLHVHARRGEVEDLEKLFNQIKSSYGIEPDILCWNIRLSAYMKIRDLDRVYECFEQILENQNLRPDHYTLGTMMALCTYRADLARARDIFRMAKEMDIPLSFAMVNCLVICLVRNNLHSEADIVCRKSTTMALIGSKTQIWNSLLIGYVLKRDLPNVNRILKFMTENNIEYDQDTYSAFMQALAITRQPYLAARVLFEVMPKSGTKPTLFNCAVLLGGYLAIKDWDNFNRLHEYILKYYKRINASTKLLLLKATASEDGIVFEGETDSQKLLRSLSVFTETMASIDPQEISETARKGYDQLPLDIMYPAVFYSFMAYILSENNEHNLASKLLTEYKSWIPRNRQKAGEVMKIITASMSAMHGTNDMDGVSDCWERAVSLAKEESSSLAPLPQTEHRKDTSEQETRYFHQLILNKPFTIFMKSMVAQKKTKELNEAVQSLISYGFDLDNYNWNTYVKYLSRLSSYTRLAFQVCEIKLMPGWQGWRIQRRKFKGRRSNVPLEIRRKKADPRSLRPYFDTLLWMGRRMINIRAKAAESPQMKKLLDLLRNEYPNTYMALNGIPRSDDETILRSKDSQFEL